MPRAIRSISVKLLVVLVPAMTAVTLAMTIGMALISYRPAVEQLERHLADQVEATSDALRGPLLRGDVEGAQRLLELVSVHPEIVCAEVDAPPITLAWPYLGCGGESNGVGTVSAEIVIGDIPDGTITAYYADHPIVADIARDAVWTFLAFLLLVTVSIAVAVFGLRSLAGVPLNRLLSSIERARAGESVEPMRSRSHDEIGRVVAAYSSMMKEIQHRTRENEAASGPRRSTAT